MPNFKRQQVSTLITRFKEHPERMIIVSGPRQTGKTTLVQQALNSADIDSRYHSADEPPVDTPFSYYDKQETALVRPEVCDREWLIRTWEAARKEANESWRGYVLALDEIQKIPQWSETIKGLWDADRASKCPLHVVILGSAPLLMQQGLTESLAGRFELIRVTHWSFSEMVNAFDFDLQSYIYFGGYPGAATFINQQPRWRDYIRASLIEPNIDRDILAMARINKPALLKRAFELGSNYSGQILSYTKMVGQLQDAGNTTTLAHYLELLSNGGLLTGLSKYAGQTHRQRASSPKLNVLNTSFMSVNSGYSFEEAQADRSFWGRLVESTVGAHLFNTGMPDIKLYYWRNSPYEIDFVMEKGHRLIGIEVKSTVRGDNSVGLAQFEEHFSPERIMLVGGQGIALEEFLAQPAGYWFDSD